MSPRASIMRPDRIEFGAWLIFDNGGGMRMTRTEPRLARNERSMLLSTTLPTSLWKTPSLKAVVNVADGDSTNIQIDVSAAQEALRQVVGADVVVTVSTPDGGASRPLSGENQGEGAEP